MCFSDGDSNGYSSDSPVSLLLEDNLEMSGFGDIHEVLRISAPKLVLLARVSHSSSSSSDLGPLALEGLLNCWRQLGYINMFGGKHSQEEGSFLFLFVLYFSVWDNDIVDILLIMDW